MHTHGDTQVHVHSTETRHTYHHLEPAFRLLSLLLYMQRGLVAMETGKGPRNFLTFDQVARGGSVVQVRGVWCGGGRRAYHVEDLGWGQSWAVVVDLVMVVVAGRGFPSRAQGDGTGHGDVRETTGNVEGSSLGGGGTGLFWRTRHHETAGPLEIDCSRRGTA